MRVLLILLFFTRLNGEEAPSLPPAPLMPLIPGDPLELNFKLREEFYEQNKSAHNLAMFQSYTIPWLSLSLLIPILILSPLILLFTQEMAKQNKREKEPVIQTVMGKLKNLSFSSLSPKDLAFQAGSLFKLGLKENPALTYEELWEAVQPESYLLNEKEDLKILINSLEKMQFQENVPSKELLFELIEKLKAILSLKNNNTLSKK